ncbi:MFS transporter [Brevibacterium daeguense]|uniref:MFS transporter n=1 Tax=Brevibacterium daeguense TaxID=909936 RepID=A0ABP8EG37_9MICO|nr:MFS transporter [Brevibacterium daeguense]
MSQDQRRILVIALVPLFMSLLSVSIVNVVLPSIEISIGAGPSGLQWVLAGYTLAFGVMLVPAGRAGDLFGRAKLFVLGVGLFGLASLVAGLAPDVVVLNIARVFMGFGSGFLNPQTVGFIQQYFKGEQRGRAFGLFGSVVGISVAIGPVLGGALIAMFGPEWGWRASFLINVPIAAIAIITALRWLPESAWHALPEALESGSHRKRPDLDPVGIVLLASATLVIMLPFLQGNAGGWIWALLPLGAVLLFAWLGWESRYKRRGGFPMVDLALFRIRSFANGSLLIGLYFTGMTSVWVVIAIFLQTGLGYTALQAGFVGLPSAICSAISAAIAGRYVVAVGRKLVVWGIGVLLLGLAASIGVIVLHETTGSSIWWLLLTLSFVGMGQGGVVSPNQTLTLRRVPMQHAGAAGGILQTGQRIGTAIGIAVITALFFTVQAVYGWTAAVVTALTTIGVIIVLSGVVAVVDLVQDRRHRE